MVDISNHQKRITAHNVDEWKATGIARVIIRASIEDMAKVAIAQQQIETCHAQGMPTDVYPWMYWEGAGQIQQVLKHYGKYQIGCYWLDCEEDAEGQSPKQLAKRIRDAVGMIGKERCGIYARRSWWRLIMRDTGEFSYLPLWDARPYTPPTLDDFIPYGGWQQCMGKQYAFNELIGGVTVNRSVFRA